MNLQNQSCFGSLKWYRTAIFPVRSLEILAVLIYLDSKDLEQQIFVAIASKLLPNIIFYPGIRDRKVGR